MSVRVRVSQRILIHLRGKYCRTSRTMTSVRDRVCADAAAEHQTKVIVSHKLQNGRDVSRAMRSQFHSGSQHKERLDDEYGLKNTSYTPHHPHDMTTNGHVLTEVDLDIQVQVEQTVEVDYYPGYEPQSHRVPRHMQDKGQLSSV